MLELVDELRQLTQGICRAGAGPYGIGVNTHHASQLQLWIRLTPTPFGDTPLSPEITECTAEVLGAVGTREMGSEHLPRAQIEQLAREGDPVTRIVADALLKLGTTPISVTVKDCEEAFDVLADNIRYGKDCPTLEEQEKIADLLYQAETAAEQQRHAAVKKEEVQKAKFSLTQAVDTAYAAMTRHKEIADRHRSNSETSLWHRACMQGAAEVAAQMMNEDPQNVLHRFVNGNPILPKPSEREIDIRLCESVFELSRIAECMEIDRTISAPDSRELFYCILDWAKEFEHGFDESGQEDYLGAIESYSSRKLQETFPYDPELDEQPSMEVTT